jgi:hypothetical protein
MARATHVRQRLRARLDADTRLAERLRGDLDRTAATPASTPAPDDAAPAGRVARQAEARPAVQARLDQATLRIGRVQAAIMALLEGLPDAVAQGEAVLHEVEGADRPASPARPDGASRGTRPPGGETVRAGALLPPPPSGRGRHRVFRTRAGNPILVASDPRDNAALTFGTATDDDLWFQVEGGGGAHVVLPASREDRPFDELLDAALLAVHFSGADPRQEIPVTCTHRRNLRPERRSAEPGAVRVVRAQTIRVRPDATRLKRLLGSERREQGGRPGKAPPRRPEPR